MIGKKLLVTGAVFAAMISGQAAAKDVTLRFAHWLPPHHALPAYGFKAWTDSITKASGGSIKFEMYPSQQLGDAKDHYDMARDGIADITWINPGYQPGRFPVAAAAELPFLANNGKAAAAAITEWYSKYAPREMQGVKMCVYHPHHPGMVHSKDKLTSLSQLRGKNVRPANATMAQYVKQLGGSSVQVPAPETRDALAKGAADAITFPSGSLILFGVSDITKYHIDYPLYVSNQAIVINQGAYNKLTKEQQKVIDNHCTPEWAEKVSAPWADFEAAGDEKLRNDPEHTMVELTPEEIDKARQAALPLHKDWQKSVQKTGHNPDQVWSELISTLKKYDSLVEKPLVQ